MARFPNLPPDTPIHLRLAFEELWKAIDPLVGTGPLDLKGRRIMNIGPALKDTDAATRGQVNTAVRRLEGSTAEAIDKLVGTGDNPGSGSGGGSTGGGGGGGAPIPADCQPVIPMPNHQYVVDAYDAAHPGQLEAACHDWTFMDGAIAALQATDPRWGFNGKRGNCYDPSNEAAAYYFGPGDPIECSPCVHVVDIIGDNCGASPHVQWNNVSGQGGAGAAWMSHRSIVHGSGASVPGHPAVFIDATGNRVGDRGSFQQQGRWEPVMDGGNTFLHPAASEMVLTADGDTVVTWILGA